MSSFSVQVDLDHGARLGSLRDPSGREWLWHHPSAATQQRRLTAAPDSGFVDAGGVEECFPTLIGVPDHGAAWSRAWTGTTTDHRLQTDSFELRRRIRCTQVATFDYELHADPGFAFIWAFHALLRPDRGTELDTDGGTVWSWDDDSRVSGHWPSLRGRRLDHLGDDDGTARFVHLPGAHRASVVQGSTTLTFSLAAPGQPAAVGLWRNLGGFSWDGAPPYRSLGVEPMIGHHPDLSRAPQDGRGRVGPGGSVSWQLALSAAAYCPYNQMT